MKRTKLNRVHIRDARAAAVFTDPRMRRFLLWFAREPKSVGDAARAFSMDPKRAHYFVTRLAELGLLTASHAQPRAGRPIRYYRAAGDVFFIPNDVAPKGFGELLARELREGLFREFSRSDGGMLFTAARNGSPRGRLVGRRGDATEMWRVLRLSRDNAEALARDMASLLNRYQARAQDQGGAVYLVHAAMARRVRGDDFADNEAAAAG